MSYNPGPPYPSAPGQGGYPPPYPPGQGDGPGYPTPQGPPPGYAYPPVPVPFNNPDNGQRYPQPPIMDQPKSPPEAGYGGAQYGFGDQGYPPSVNSGQVHMQYGQPQMQQQPYAQPPIQIQPTSSTGYGQTVALNVPPGLEFLSGISQLMIKQKVELLEAAISAFLGCETKNKYKVRDSEGRDLYTAKEDTDCCTRNFCGKYRPFDLKIKDLQDREVIHLNRPLACDSCLCPCWLQSLEVYAPPGQLVGTVEQEWSIFVPKFVIKDAQGEVVLRIEGPFCTFSLCGDVQFQILSRDGATQVGKISKKWSGLAREMFTDADNFGINFPMDLDVRMKAVMLGASFLIDFMFFEKSQNKENDGLGMF